jgi:hypothetical protein
MTHIRKHYIAYLDKEKHYIHQILFIIVIIVRISLDQNFIIKNNLSFFSILKVIVENNYFPNIIANFIVQFTFILL